MIQNTGGKDGWCFWISLGWIGCPRSLFGRLFGEFDPKRGSHCSNVVHKATEI